MYKLPGFIFLSEFVFLYLHFSLLGYWWPNKSNLLNLLLFTIGSIITFFPVEIAHQHINKLLPWNKKIFLRFVADLNLNWITINITSLALICAYLYFDKQSLSVWFYEHKELILKFEILVFITSLFYTVAGFYLIMSKKHTSLEIERLQLLSNKYQLQYDLLRSQLSPHYLFNTLNTISALLYRDKKLSSKYIRKFAETLDYILSQNEKTLVPLNDELKFLDSFFYLFKIRYENAVVIKNRIKTVSENQLIPPLSLQILIENAVKHTEFNDQSPLEISITINGNYIEVANKINKIQASKHKHKNESFKIGLDNIIQRYKYFTHKKPLVKETDYFSVSIPIIKATNYDENILR